MKEGLLAVSSAPAGPLGAEAEEENYSTGDASLDNIRNQDNIGERELLAVSFGTSYNDSRRLTIGAIEEEMERAFPEFSVRRAFTSQIILNHVRSRDGISMDNVKEALARAADNGVKTLVIQPTHLMNGLEYHDLVAEAAGHVELFEQVVIGEPLLTSERDFQLVMEAVTEYSGSGGAATIRISGSASWPSDADGGLRYAHGSIDGAVQVSLPASTFTHTI